MSNINAKKQLIDMYGPICFLGDTPNNKNKLTYHHIKPVREGKETTIENGALLSERMHWLFNKIEKIDPKTAEYLNEYFQYYKETYDEDERIRMYYFVIRYCYDFLFDKSNKKVLSKIKNL
jgi:hypothetical protein